MKTVAIIGCLLSFIMATAVADDTTRVFIGWDGQRAHTSGNNPRIGLALSGGGARGLAQVGVLKALEEAEIEIAAISGTSIGGIVGGLYASGYSAAELEQIIKQIDFVDLFSNRPSRTSMLLTQRPGKDRSLLSIRFDGFNPYIPRALTAGQKLTDLLSRLTLRANYQSTCDFSRLPIPFRAVTTDIVTGDRIVIGNGNLSDAMRATMAFPLAFTGVDVDDMILMDGGMVDPIPIDVTREISADLDLAVAVNTTSDLLPREQIADPIDIANQVTTIMTMEKMRDGLERADLVIRPELNGIYSTDFNLADSLIELGYLAGKKAVDEINRLTLPANGADTILITDVTTVSHGSIERPSTFVNPGEFITKREIVDQVQRLFWDYNLFSIAVDIIADRNPDGNHNRARLEINIVPEPNHRTITSDITGNTVFDDSTILVLFNHDRHDLTQETLRRFSDSLPKLYENRGYDLAHIKHLSYDPENNRLLIEIDEGIVQKININGNRRTKSWLIKSNISLKEGFPFNSREAGRGINNIYATDLFERVIMDISPGDRGAIININVEEKKYTQFRFGWHWHDEYKSEQFAEILNDNLLGTGQELLAHLQYAPRRQNYYLSLKADRFFSTYLTYRVIGFYNILERNTYDNEGTYLSSFRERRFGAELVVGQQIARFGTVTGELRFEEIENDILGGGTERMQLRSFTLRSLVENFDRYAFTNEGKKHLFYVTFAADVLGGETKFTKIYSSVESYFPLTDQLNFHPRLAIGYTNTKFGIPSSEKFYIGGHYSMYGYRTDELVGAKMFLMNLELRFKLPLRFYISGRYDTGEVYSSVDQIKLKRLRHAYGLSLAFDAPFGPIDFGYGKSGSNPDRFYIDIGLRF